ncbi:hypothetical protein OR1_03137 [Geobacter sp. OR-1]|uniref:hypothetical protein n=1 Tax=Geobacter sp. OR-1 TaxID=1266765 RepID=UPI00054391AE|nr:hypothetical protein [Geobacter sp. OR-1]GAM10838.1 hypothetical protein OR1_03137 [Geobacter sp. OR-1]
MIRCITLTLSIFMLCQVSTLLAAESSRDSQPWYAGDERCPPPKNDGTYSAPYNPMDHKYEYPMFDGADKPGWSCSYQREDGIIVQFGDSRTPQEQWLAVWGDFDNNN